MGERVADDFCPECRMNVAYMEQHDYDHRAGCSMETPQQKARREARVPCDECHVRDIARHGHGLGCTQQTLGERAQGYERAYRNALDLLRRQGAQIQRVRDEVAAWQAKHAVVRHENNVLRRRLHPQSSASPVEVGRHESRRDQENAEPPQTEGTP